MQTIFSRYSQGENRVTSSILAVVRLLSLPTLEYLLGGLLSNGKDDLFSITDQPSSGGVGVPDGELRASFRVLLETKTTNVKTMSEDDKRQLSSHLDRLNGTHSTETLLYLTPDSSCPVGISSFDSERLVWRGFEDLYELLTELIDEHPVRLSSDETFMLSHLRAMLENEGLIGSADNVLVVAANRAWRVYQETGLYKCQVGRSFRNVDYIAFYCDGEVKPLIAAINHRHLEVTIAQLDNLEVAQSLCLAFELDQESEHPTQLFELSRADDPQTQALGEPIPNDCISSKTGATVPFTYGQTYTSLDKLLVPNQTTSGLRGEK